MYEKTDSDRAFIADQIGFLRTSIVKAQRAAHRHLIERYRPPGEQFRWCGGAVCHNGRRDRNAGSEYLRSRGMGNIYLSARLEQPCSTKCLLRAVRACSASFSLFST